MVGRSSDVDDVVVSGGEKKLLLLRCGNGRRSSVEGRKRCSSVVMMKVLQGLHIEPVRRVVVKKELGGLQHGHGPVSSSRGYDVEVEVGVGGGSSRGGALELVGVLVAAEGLGGVELAVAEVALEGACGAAGGGRWWCSLSTTV